MSEDVPMTFKGCCALKRPWTHEGPFTCPQCGVTHPSDPHERQMAVARQIMAKYHGALAKMND